MEHGVRVDAVVAGVAAPGGAHPALVVALLAEKVVEIECDDERLVLEEGLGDLTVPQQLVGVGRGVVVSPAAVLVFVPSLVPVLPLARISRLVSESGFHSSLTLPHPLLLRDRLLELLLD